MKRDLKPNTCERRHKLCCIWMRPDTYKNRPNTHEKRPNTREKRPNLCCTWVHPGEP